MRRQRACRWRSLLCDRGSAALQIPATAIVIILLIAPRAEQSIAVDLPHTSAPRAGLFPAIANDAAFNDASFDGAVNRPCRSSASCSRSWRQSLLSRSVRALPVRRPSESHGNCELVRSTEAAVRHCHTPSLFCRNGVGRFRRRRNRAPVVRTWSCALLGRTHASLGRCFLPRRSSLRDRECSGCPSMR